MIGMITALALAAKGPAPMNAERYWTLSRNNERSCTASARADNGDIVLLGLSGRISFAVAGDSLPRDVRTIELRAGDRRQALPAKVVGRLIAENGEGLSSASIVALRTATTLAVALDGRVAMKLDLAGSGTPRLVDDLIDCSLGKAGWWDGAPAAPPEPSTRRTASAADGDDLLPPAPPGAKPGSIPMGPAGSR